MNSESERSDPSSAAFEEFRNLVDSGNRRQALENLARRLMEAGKFHELFEVRKMQLREQMGIPVRSTESSSQLPAEQQPDYEKGLIAACEEVGQLLFERNRIREAWGYLQAIDQQSDVETMIAECEINDENAEDLVSIAIQEGLAPVQGLQWILQREGTCNAITTYDSYFLIFSLDVRRAAAEKLVVHLRDELRGNVLRHIQQHRADADTNQPMTLLVENFPWIFEDGSRHIDESHLASVVRIGRIANNSAAVEAAIDLCVYGQNMPSDYSATGDSPFDDLYVDSEVFYRALSGENQEAAVAKFREAADACDVEHETAAKVEWYLYLLQQLGRESEAIRESIRLLPETGPQMNIAPNLFELCSSRDDWRQIQQHFLQRNRLLEYSVAVLEGQQA